MTLGQKQEMFARAVPLLILYAQYHGYELRLGDLFRDPRSHGGFGEKSPYGNSRSCHKLKLAIDINLVQDGIYLEGKPALVAHNFLHDFWDMLGGSARIDNDLNHYSFEHQGAR